MRTSQPGTGIPTHTPCPVPMRIRSASETSATGRTSVMPYGVCNSASGHRRETSCNVLIGTGAPADITRRTLARCSIPVVAVRTTFAKAAGEANTIVAPTRRHASSSAAAVNVPGDVTSISANPVAIPNAGPYKAKGAKAATNVSVGMMLYVFCKASRCAYNWRCV